MSKSIIKIEPDITYVLGVFTAQYEKQNEVDNPRFRPGYQYSYIGSVLNNAGIKTIQDLWNKNPYNLDTKRIWNLYSIDETGKKTWTAQGQFVSQNENLADDIPDAMRSRQQSALNDENIATQRLSDISGERDYLRNRVRELEELVSQQQQQLLQANNSLMQESQKRIEAETELQTSVSQVKYESAEELMQLKSEIRELKKQHELEIELKQKAIEETLRDEMGQAELTMAQQQQETLMGLISMAKPALELGVSVAIGWLNNKINSNNPQQQLQQQPQQPQQIASYDPNVQPNMYAESEVLN